MKISHSHTPPNLQREPHAGKTAKAGGGEVAPSGITVTLSEAAQNASATDGTTTGAPAGLLKVQARLQDLGEARTRGQGVALERISRNIARYLENQAPAAVSAPAPASVEAPSTDPVAELPVTDTPAETAESPAEGPVETPAEAPAQAPADAVAALPADNTQALLDALDNSPDASA